jgi:hypothetical protein
MFTLEDLDIDACVAALTDADPAFLRLQGHPIPEADARLHPRDYLVVGA